MEQERRQYYGTSAGEVDNSFDNNSFEDETSEDHIDCSSFIEPVHRLSRELEGLIIRYDPKAIPIPTPTNVIKDSAIYDGERIPRLIVNGVDPISKCRSSLRQKSGSTPPTMWTTGSESSLPKKRRPEGPDANSQRAPKKSKTASNLVWPHERSSSVPAPETQTQANLALQISHYLLEMFSVPLLHSARRF
ncbi:hypothetical protein BJ322DRAFT_1109116 [Thelephora terrestris]|uniref:Uncharacterized protein n=1 Tax=Thelephora terrestris TaxID=56493 RepID=A0A9P6HET9_9AGAM|nr:hypothetical protein BJ322DRAFT_1109116 [Thelephora terrestris]